ncbi:mannose-1-phosphate guanylyltransferase [Clostridium aestuarii]|uniref:Mannose-1-phosphate guanylyltransferase n=1 Tax=Clostridium aestuarii TaxID=338193 RepID=A0ABT4CXS8_9CLOT|nr:mannose-1-phosphate guanylyltransferase [Clostridium aestuarii]MCY6482755.1 mannose-1-phosphate guanylyltransferase [Clostridium aestuarii]
MLCALIMAGGKGTRFWPVSTKSRPKQFLKLLGEDTMIQMTVKRLRKLISIERIFIITEKRYIHLVKEQLPELPQRNIIMEPIGKNTAPCIALSAFYINKICKNSTIAVLPADHLIVNEEEFIETLKDADEFVEKRKEAIVTIGMKPNRAEIGYGYIKFSDMDCVINRHEIRKVQKFVEKPNKEKAEQYLKEGHYLWNAGMFIWKTSNILRLTKLYLENTFNILREITELSDEEYQKSLEEKYTQVDSISVDYGIMEKADNIYVIPSAFGWDDVGSWSALERCKKKDCNGNVSIGNVKSIDGRNNIIVSNSKSIIIDGVNDIYVVENDGVIIIGKKDRLVNIKELKETVG